MEEWRETGTQWKANFYPANENRLSKSYLSSQVIRRVCSTTHTVAAMAVNPLEGLMSVAVSQQLVCSSTAEPQRQQPCAAGSPASLHGHRQSTRSSREPRKWVQSVCGSVVQPRTLKAQHSPENAARERSRVRNLRQAFHSLQAALPSVPPDTKLSKLDVLVLATDYIAYLTETLDQGGMLAEHTLPPRPGGYLHPVKNCCHYMTSFMPVDRNSSSVRFGVQSSVAPPRGQKLEQVVFRM
ncbi:hypothetical protein L3Q82_001230 [Scortum barcoo]|uniref:Uncharacterized protein n=1 Tax=Scortum barcoo TaxID=214431 RepID=A0ACB8W843_9TELE|nr:hypothetical protein L3Q82_001230 [Scortum barcoo]